MTVCVRCTIDSGDQVDSVCDLKREREMQGRNVDGFTGSQRLWIFHSQLQDADCKLMT